MTNEPLYDEDLVNKGYLDKVLGNNTADIIENDITMVKNYGTKPQPPYHKGNTYTEDAKLYTCIKSREIGYYDPGDWSSESGSKELAQNALDVAVVKTRTFLLKPTKFNSGDIWILENDTVHAPDKQGTILIAVANSDIYIKELWVKKDRYTDDTVANIANSLLADLSSDSKLTAVEKQSVKKEWDVIVSELSIINTQADEFQIITEKANYNTYYTVLNNYIVPLLIDLTITTNIDSSVFRENFKNYYDARTKLLNKISSKAKIIADNAQLNIDNLSTQTKTISGTELTLDKCNGNNLLNYEFEGNSSQVVTVTGKNKLNGIAWRGIFTGNGFVQTGNTTTTINSSTKNSVNYSTSSGFSGAETNLIPVIAGTTYTLSFINTLSNRLFITQYDSNKIRVSTLNSPANVSTTTFTATQNGYIGIAFSNTTAISNANVSNIQLELGSSATSFEAHIPNSPSVDYPSPILNSGDGGTITVRSSDGVINTDYPITLPAGFVGGRLPNDIKDTNKMQYIKSVTFSGQSTTIADMKPNGSFLSTRGGTVSGTTITLAGIPTGTTTVYYELASPIDVSSIIILPEIITYQDDTHITTTNLVKPKLTATYLLKNAITAMFPIIPEITKKFSNVDNYISLINQELENISLIVGDQQLYIDPDTGQIINAITRFALIKLSIDNINIEVSNKVNENEIISKINLSPEVIKLVSSKIALEGYTTINGSFTIDENGNVSIANDTILLNGTGITLANGARLIGGNGVLSTFVFDSGDWQEVGYYDTGGMGFSKIGIDFAAYIPLNFVIISAKINFQHSPKYISDLPNDNAFSTPLTNEWCYSRNVKVYTYGSSNYYRVGIYASEEIDNPNLIYSEIIGALGSSGFTATPPTVPPSSNPQNVVQSYESPDIKSSLTVGQYNNIKIGTSDAVPNYDTDWKNGYKKTGLCRATLTVIGYMKQ